MEVLDNQTTSTVAESMAQETSKTILAIEAPNEIIKGTDWALKHDK